MRALGQVKSRKLGPFRYPPAFMSCLCVSFVVVYMTSFLFILLSVRFFTPLLHFFYNCVSQYDQERSMHDVWADVLAKHNRTKMEQSVYDTVNFMRILEQHTFVIQGARARNALTLLP